MGTHSSCSLVRHIIRCRELFLWSGELLNVQTLSIFPKLLLLLLSSGITSVFERVLLAITQQRQSPVNATLFGISNLVLDGIKLFSKLNQEIFGNQLNTFLLGIFLISPILLDFVFCRSTLTSWVTANWFTFIFLAELLELSVLLFAIGNRNHFVDLALTRTLEIATLTELVTFLLVLLLLFSGNILPHLGFSHYPIILLFCLFLFVPMLLETGKVPFDLVEAESELIDGLSVDISGGVFSCFYAAEVFHLLIALKIFVATSFTIWGVLFFSLGLLAFFVGRVFLARYLISETIATFLSIGLLLSPIAVAIN